MTQRLFVDPDPGAASAIEYLLELPVDQVRLFRMPTHVPLIGSLLTRVPEAVLSQVPRFNEENWISLAVPVFPGLGGEFLSLRNANPPYAFGKDARGHERWLVAWVSTEIAHAVATRDEVFRLRLCRRIPDSQVFRPEDAARLAGLLGRYRDDLHLQRQRTGHLRLSAEDFREGALFASIPELWLGFELVGSAPTDQQRGGRLHALMSSVVSRLTGLAMGEDEIAFLTFFPHDPPRVDLVAYHLEHVLLVAQATLEGLKTFAAELVGLSTRLPWKRFRRQIRDQNAEAADFLGCPSALALMDVLGALRHPLAHDQHWWETRELPRS